MRSVSGSWISSRHEENNFLIKPESGRSSGLGSAPGKVQRPNRERRMSASRPQSAFQTTRKPFEWLGGRGFQLGLSGVRLGKLSAKLCPSRRGLAAPAPAPGREETCNLLAERKRGRPAPCPSHLPTLRALSQLPVAHVVRSWVCVSIPPPKVSSLVLTGKVRKGKQHFFLL